MTVPTLMMTLTLGLFGSAAVVAAQGGPVDGEDAPPAEGGATPSPIPYPEVEVVIDPAPEETDARDLLEEALVGVGLERLDQLTSIAFERISSHWRGEKLAFWERVATQARLEGELAGRVDMLSEIDPDNGRPLNTVFVENRDDKFMMINRSVLASEENEAQAARMLRNEVFALLGPWLALREASEVRLIGKVSVDTWEFDYSDENGASNYRPVKREWVKLLVEIPRHYVIACGVLAEVYLDPESNEIRRVRHQFHGREGIYGMNRVSMNIAEWQEVGGSDEGGPNERTGALFPKRIYMNPVNDAMLREVLEFSAIRLDPGVAEKDLRRP